eukprot:CAMPEP_0194489222 /NCGR_PEP_ID=MMETSP0253-20130528/8845_1 /TAXON_ID=2966 /ORGANISM="Noctiluca scintillans" /LENGTH=42 /DNA_ID= /DNA_START= /DNA_END= /DNA_ORIENTATION=
MRMLITVVGLGGFIHSALAETYGKFVLYKQHDMCLDLPGGSS